MSINEPVLILANCIVEISLWWSDRPISKVSKMSYGFLKNDQYKLGFMIDNRLVY